MRADTLLRSRTEADAGEIERRHYRRTTQFAYRMVLPSVLFVGVFIALPLVFSVSVAFERYRDGVGTGEYVWFENFADIFSAPTVAPAFYQSLATTAIFTVAAVITVIALSLGIAIVIHNLTRGAGVLKVALLLPYAIPGVVSAVIWDWIFDSDSGVLNALLSSLGLIDGYIDFTSSTSGALFAIWVAYVWNFIPYSAFIFTAGLATIPASVLEAARLDRSGPVRRFFKITLPLLKPVLQIALVIQTVYALVMHFSLVAVMTQGGPANATRTLPWLIYETTFAFGRFDRGAAMAVFLAACMAVVIYVYLVVLDPDRRARRASAKVARRAGQQP